jgi:hypothetical protein
MSCGAQHKVARLPVGKIDRREKILCWMHESSRSGEFRWMTERSTTLSASVLVTPTLLKAYLMNRSAPSRGDMCHLLSKRACLFGGALN